MEILILQEKRVRQHVLTLLIWWRIRDSNPGPADYDTRYNETSSSVFKRLRQDLKTPQTQPREIRPKPA